jgi:hypothetical protein
MRGILLENEATGIKSRASGLAMTDALHIATTEKVRGYGIVL